MRHAALAVVLLAVFLASTLWARSAIAHNSDTQQQLQVAQFQRGRLLKLQLDEETGVRGYIATGSRAFLQPYDSARRTFPAMYAQLDQTIVGLGLSDEPVRREGNINERWLEAVALPAVTGARKVDPKAQRLGKLLVDTFRANDNRLTAEIRDRSHQVDANTNELVTRVLFGSIGLGVIIVLVVTGYGFVQNRLSRRLDVLQNAFLRPKLPSFPNVSLHAAYVPAHDETRVGGDWYDAYAINDRLLLFSIGDVSGHGLEAAVAMSRVRQSITTAAMGEADPAAVLRVANEVLLLQEGRMVTVACGFIDLDKGKVRFSTAGHPPMLFVPARGPVVPLATGGPPLGAMASPPYRSSSMPIEAGAALVLYTDGLIERDHDTIGGERKLREAVRGIDFRNCDDPASTLLASIFSGVPPADDVAILTLTFQRATIRPLRMLCA